MPPLASVLVPTHSHASTLEIAVRSALGQTIQDVEVLIIGDGVTADVRAVAERLVAADNRVRFFDHPKGENHGEHYRDLAVRAARSDAIFYLCDDDIFMRDHVADLLALLDTHNLVQCKNGYLTEDGTVVPFLGDLADPASIAHLKRDDVTVNFVSVTGTAHSRRFYLDLDERWSATPTGVFPDWFQWRRMTASAGFRGATSTRMTALQFPSSADGRDGWPAERRRTELERWASLAASVDGQAVVDDLVARGDRAALIQHAHEVLRLQLRQLPVIDVLRSLFGQRFDDAVAVVTTPEDAVRVIEEKSARVALWADAAVDRKLRR